MNKLKQLWHRFYRHWFHLNILWANEEKDLFEWNIDILGFNLYIHLSLDNAINSWIFGKIFKWKGYEIYLHSWDWDKMDDGDGWVLNRGFIEIWYFPEEE